MWKLFNPFSKFIVRGLFAALLYSPISNAGSLYSSFSYETVGEGKDIVLIPGLMSDSRVWNATVEALRSDFRVHTISIAGFGSTPLNGKVNTLNAVKIDMADYISKLSKPTIIGHSLGGFVGLSLAIERPESIESVISVDGLPFIGPVFTQTSNTKVSDIANQAHFIRKHFAGLSRAQLRQEVLKGIHVQATTKESQTTVIEMSSLSDAGTAGEMIYELMSTDLRPLVHNITADVMLLGGAGAMPDANSKKRLESLYKDQFKSLSSAKVKINNGARHFIMLDDFDWFIKSVLNFLGERNDI